MNHKSFLKIHYHFNLKINFDFSFSSLFKICNYLIDLKWKSEEILSFVILFPFFLFLLSIIYHCWNSCENRLYKDHLRSLYQENKWHRTFLPILSFSLFFSSILFIPFLFPIFLSFFLDYYVLMHRFAVLLWER